MLFEEETRLRIHSLHENVGRQRIESFASSLQVNIYGQHLEKHLCSWFNYSFLIFPLYCTGRTSPSTLWSQARLTYFVPLAALFGIYLLGMEYPEL